MESVPGTILGTKLRKDLFCTGSIADFERLTLDTSACVPSKIDEIRDQGSESILTGFLGDFPCSKHYYKIAFHFGWMAEENSRKVNNF